MSEVPLYPQRKVQTQEALEAGGSIHRLWRIQDLHASAIKRKLMMMMMMLWRVPTWQPLQSVASVQKATAYGSTEAYSRRTPMPHYLWRQATWFWRKPSWSRRQCVYTHTNTTQQNTHTPSLIRNRPPPLDPSWTLGIGLR